MLAGVIISTRHEGGNFYSPPMIDIMLCSRREKFTVPQVLNLMNMKGKILQSPNDEHCVPMLRGGDKVTVPLMFNNNNEEGKTLHSPSDEHYV